MLHHPLITLCACACACACAPVASAAPALAAEPETTASANWAGYVAKAAAFATVRAAWTVPTIACDGQATYSAAWVGLGGYASSSQALEQTGTEADCTKTHGARYSAWYEVVPDSGHDLRLTVHPGDKVAALVTVVGRRVTMRVTDKTRGTRVTKHVTARQVDTSSADWVVEAPSLCASGSVSTATCFSSSLADFGTTLFAHARATSTQGHEGAVSDASWSTVRITLSPSPSFGASGFGPPGLLDSTGATSGSAHASDLNADGDAFSVSYEGQASTRRRSAAAAPEHGLASVHVG